MNNFSYRIYGIKNATLHENNFFKGSKYMEKNIINKKAYNSTKDVLKQIPISAIRGYFMPVIFNSNKLVNIMSAFKIISSFLFFYYCYFIYKNRSIKNFQIVSGIIIIFLPLVGAVDLVTSNYFTYLRYVYPFNIFLILITFSFIVNQIKMKND